MYSSPTYPQSNEQVEDTNKTIVNGLKKETREDERKLGRGGTESVVGLPNHTEKVSR